MKAFKILGGCTGLNTKVDPVRLPYNADTGVQDLAVAYNLDIDDTGRISRRKGFTKQKSLDCHSLFAKDGVCLFVSGDGLYWLNADYTYKALRNVTVGATMRYEMVDGIVYYLNGSEIGKAAEGISAAWTKGDADTYVEDTTLEYFDPPVGTDITYYNGRMYIAQGDTIWYSEPFGFNLFRLSASHWMVDSEVRLLRAVESGVYVGSEHATYFYKGDNPRDAVRTVVADYPPIKYTDVSFHGHAMFPLGQGMQINVSSGYLSAMWLSREGICYGGHDGALFNLTMDKMDELPSGVSGSGLFYQGKYIGLINP